mgnify:CR=1 FL=1|jgi:protein tyrosine phosphatase (PTP) superfamily phosphohydrolase (DUF442 family)
MDLRGTSNEQYFMSLAFKNLWALGLVSLMMLPLSAELAPNDEVIKHFSKRVLNKSRAGEIVAFGGVTERSALTWLKAEGYRSVINLRLEPERPGHIDLMMAEAKVQGLQYVHLPFDPRAEGDVVSQFLELMRTRGFQPAYIHCNSATRAAALWMIFRVQEDGLDFDAAKAEVTEIAGRPDAAIAFAAGYLSR